MARSSSPVRATSPPCPRDTTPGWWVTSQPSSSTGTARATTPGRNKLRRHELARSKRMTINHAEVMEELSEQYSPVLDASPDGVYLWLDDAHKVCNERLARMFGYSVD